MKIIVKDEQEKQDLLKLCQYLHDFTVFFTKAEEVKIVRSFDGSIPTEIVEEENVVGISLDHEMFPLLQLLVALHDADPKEVREEIISETVIVEEHFNKFQLKK